MAWQPSPGRVRHEGGSSEGFTLSTSLPVGEDDRPCNPRQTPVTG